MNKRLVAIEKAVASRQEITLEPALALMLAEDLHHLAVGGQKFVVRFRGGLPLALRHLEERFKAVGQSFVRPENPEVSLLLVQFGNVAHKWPHGVRIANAT